MWTTGLHFLPLDKQEAVREDGGRRTEQAVQVKHRTVDEYQRSVMKHQKQAADPKGTEVLQTISVGGSSVSGPL